MSKKEINTTTAPSAVGPYSQAIEVGNTVFCSGQIPLVPETMKFIDGGVEEQTAQVLKNLKEVLKAADLSVASIAKTTILLAEMSDFKKVNEVYANFFLAESPDSPPPARATFAVKELPLGALIEIDCIAVRS